MHIIRRKIATNTGTNVCDDHAKLMTHISLGNSVACERHLGFPSRYDGVLFAYFDYLLESFGFKTCKFGGSHGPKIAYSKPAAFSLFVLFLLVLFRLFFFWELSTYPTYGIGYHFEIVSSQVDPDLPKKSSFHALTVTMSQLFSID